MLTFFEGFPKYTPSPQSPLSPNSKSPFRKWLELIGFNLQRLQRNALQMLLQVFLLWSLHKLILFCPNLPSFALLCCLILTLFSGIGIDRVYVAWPELSRSDHQDSEADAGSLPCTLPLSHKTNESVSQDQVVKCRGTNTPEKSKNLILLYTYT